MIEVRELIHRAGPVPFSVFMGAALYGPSGFYTRGGGAGRRRDFLTSPEVGPLFGAVLAQALDTWWDEAAQPDPFFVAESGAGPGTLCRDVLRAGPRCAGALRYVLVDLSEPMRTLHRSLRVPLVEPFELMGSSLADADGEVSFGPGQGPLVCSLAELPTEPIHVVLANELLDNLAFDVTQRGVNGWKEIRIGLGNDGAFLPTLIDLDLSRSHVLFDLVPDAPVGCSVPLQHAAVAWIGEARSAVASTGGRVVAIDYGASMAELAGRDGQWLRTYRDHQRGIDPLGFAGTCDITADVGLDFVGRVHHPATVSTQADFLRQHGIEGLMNDARAVWTARADIGDLAAVSERSLVGGGEALLDPAGLGAFVVMEWRG